MLERPYGSLDLNKPWIFLFKPITFSSSHLMLENLGAVFGAWYFIEKNYGLNLKKAANIYIGYS